MLELGIVAQEPDPELTKSADRATRVHVQARLYRELVPRHGITAIAAEAASFNALLPHEATRIGEIWSKERHSKRRWDVECQPDGDGADKLLLRVVEEISGLASAN